MEKRRIAVIGGGPAGFIAAVSAAENFDNPNALQIDVYEKAVPLKTILYTGNGRCNLSNNVSDFKELALNYPRGEKFLYSVFSRFGVLETIEWLAQRGLETYVQEDGRIFPKTDRAASVRDLFLKKASEYGIKTIKTCVKTVSKEMDKFVTQTDTVSEEYDIVILATGGRTNSVGGYEIAKTLGHSITELRPALTSLATEENWPKKLAGVTVKNSRIEAFFNKKKKSDLTGDFVFTHQGFAGPVVFNTSSYCTFLNYSRENPLILKINFLPSMSFEEIQENLQRNIEDTPGKAVSNILKNYISRSLASELLTTAGINPDKKASSLNSREFESIIKILCKTELKVISAAKDGEIVTAGGVELKEVDSRTMESKLVRNLYFCGEILDIDGLTGGFNLQMCWSTGYIAGLNAAHFW